MWKENGLFLDLVLEYRQGTTEAISFSTLILGLLRCRPQ